MEQHDPPAERMLRDLHEADTWLSNWVDAEEQHYLEGGTALEWFARCSDDEGRGLVRQLRELTSAHEALRAQVGVLLARFAVKRSWLAGTLGSFASVFAWGSPVSLLVCAIASELADRAGEKRKSELCV